MESKLLLYEDYFVLQGFPDIKEFFTIHLLNTGIKITNVLEELTPSCVVVQQINHTCHCRLVLQELEYRKIPKEDVFIYLEDGYYEINPHGSHSSTILELVPPKDDE